MFNKLKNILGGDEKTEAPVVRMPEVRPFGNMETETAPPPAHRPDHVKANISHAGHMRIIARNDDEAARICAEALRATREKKTVMYGDDAISAYFSDFPYLKFLTTTKNSDTVCAFPFFNVGKPMGARITEITECENGYEGQLEIFTKGSVLTFYDALYFKGKNTYFPGKEGKVLLSGIAYVLTKSRDAPASDYKGSRHEAVDSGYLAFHYENGDVDDYVFRGKVKEVREFSVLGKKAQALKVPLRIGADSVLEIFVCVTENATGEKITRGDYVSGIMWLQGFVL